MSPRAWFRGVRSSRCGAMLRENGHRVDDRRVCGGLVEDRIWHRATVRILPAQLTACALFTAVQVHTAGVAAGREDGLPDASSRACTCRRCTRGRMDSYASPEGQGWPGLGALRASLSDAEVGSPGGYPSPQALFQDPSSPHAPCGTVTRRMDKMCTLYTVFLYIHTHRYARVTQRARAAGNLAAAQGRRRRLAEQNGWRRGCEGRLSGGGATRH